MEAAATWATDLNVAYCTWAVRCGRFADAAACNAHTAAEFAIVNFNAPSAAITAVSRGTARFDSVQATSCLTALAHSACDSELLSTVRIPPPCSGVFSGSLSDGSDCIDDVECADGSMCVIASTATCKGVCTPVSRFACRTNDDCPAQQYCAAVPLQGSGLWGSGVCDDSVAPGASEGAPCGTPVQCAPGFYCPGGPAPGGGCEADVGAGADCDETGRVGPDCSPGLACVVSDDGTTAATCMPPAKLGEPCTSLFQCGAEYELNDITCDETGTHTCVHRPSSGPCKIVNWTDTTCDPLTSYCDSMSSGTLGSGNTSAGTCKPLLARGAACVLGAINPCGPLEECRGAVCTPSPVGACTPE